MTTATPKKKKDALDELAELQGAHEEARQRHSELSRRLHAKRVALEGSDRNVGGLLDQLHRLRVRDPQQFTADGTPTGAEAKRVSAAIEEIGDLEPIVAERDHARLVEERAQRDLTAHIAAHLDPILEAQGSESEAVAGAVEIAIANLRSALDSYIAHTQYVAGLLGAGRRDTRIDGADHAAELRRAIEGWTVPTPEPHR